MAETALPTPCSCVWERNGQTQTTGLGRRNLSQWRRENLINNENSQTACGELVAEFQLGS